MLGHRKVKLAQFCGVNRAWANACWKYCPRHRTEDTTSRRLSRRAAPATFGLSERFALPSLIQPVGQQLRRAPLLEAFIAAFYQAVAAVIRGGLLRQYLEYEADLRVVRGRIAT